MVCSKMYMESYETSMDIFWRQLTKHQYIEYWGAINTSTSIQDLTFLCGKFFMKFATFFDETSKKVIENLLPLQIRSN